MGNPLYPTTHKGTLGELLVQLRLLEYGIQSAPPIKDSGNDLIAIKGEVVKFIQVKTGRLSYPKNSKIYHLIANVKLKYSEQGELQLDKSEIYIVEKGKRAKDKVKLTKELTDEIWKEYN